MAEKIYDQREEQYALKKKRAVSGTSECSCWVLNVTEDDHVANCPNCRKMIRADSIDFDDAKCTECGVKLQIKVAPNDQHHAEARSRLDAIAGKENYD